MTPDTAQLRRELADTRDRMSTDIDELRNRAKERLDLARVVREHPWSAVGAAVALGALIGGSGADERAVAAAREAVGGTIDKLRARAQHDESEPRVVEEHRRKPGIADRFVGMIGATVALTLDRVIDEVRVASRDFGTRMATPRARAARAAAPVAAATTAAVAHHVATNRAVDTVPVPSEIAPAELGLRADAVEALGGGTHEPPLEPGAGELGARWS